VGVVGPIFGGGAPGEAVEPLERALVASPSDFFTHWDLAYVRCMRGELAAAQRHVDWLLAALPELPYVIQADALLRALRGDRAGALARIVGLDLAAFDAHLTFHIAELYAVTGEIARGLDVLALAVAKGFTPVEFIAAHCALLEPLRSEARFAGIVEEARRRREEVRQAVAR
jgi:hypothetical protein